MKLFKRFGVALLAVLTLAAVLAGPVLAAEPGEGGIAVQLDGETLVFTDAVPEISDDHTFLPFRAVLEAMGAEVGYDAATGTVSARKGGLELSMIPGQTTLTVARDGQTSTAEMDVAPYINAANDRTYIPVSFAAEALGYAVGWDEANRTVILADVDALFGDATFTLLDKLKAYAAKQEITGNMALTGSLDMEAAGVSGAEPIHIGGSVEGVVGRDGVQLTAKVDGTDLLYAILAPMMGESEDAAQLKEILKSLPDMLSCELRAGLEAETAYISLPQILALLGGEGDEEDSGWRSLDLAPYKEQLAGIIDIQQILQMKDLPIGDLMLIVIKSLPLTDKNESYPMLKQVAQVYVDLFSDQAFTKDGGAYTATAALMDVADFEITLTEEGEDITAMGMDMTFTDEVSGTTMTMTVGSAPDAVSMEIKASSTDEESGIEITVQMKAAAALTDKIPETALPEGVEAKPLTLNK